MNMMKGVFAATIVLSAASPSFAGRRQMNSAVESLKQAASAQGALGAVYDNSATAAGEASSQAVEAGRTLQFRPSLAAPKITPVDHRYRRLLSPNVVVWRMRSRNPAERGFDWMMHPASEMIKSSYAILMAGGIFVAAVLFVPAIIAGAVNAVIGL